MVTCIISVSATQDPHDVCLSCVFLLQILESFFHHHSQVQVRMIALSVITLVLRQGLVHPVQVGNPPHCVLTLTLRPYHAPSAGR